MSKHTPGPWYNDGYRIYAPTDSKDKRDGRVIVEYKHVPDFIYADADLMTAAPELLKVAICEDALEMDTDIAWGILASYGWKSEDRFNYPATAFVRDMRRAAIAKAKGE